MGDITTVIEMVSLFSFEVKFLKARFGQMCKYENTENEKFKLELNCREYFAMKSSLGLQQFLAVESHFGQFFTDMAIFLLSQRRSVTSHWIDINKIV